MAEEPRDVAGADGVAGVRSLAPVFVSYRFSDGAELAEDLAWALRGYGVPVWHDLPDLPPGDISRRLDEALVAGLSGAVMAVTPDMRRSWVVRNIELQSLLRMEADPRFTLAVGNAVPDADRDSLDDLVTGSPNVLGRFKQYALLEPAGRAALARDMAMRRMAVVRAAGMGTLVLDLQTRSDPGGAPPEVPLVVRTRPPLIGARVPEPRIWAELKGFLAELPLLVRASGARELRVQGGAHLSVAFALGAALPTTAPWAVTIEDRDGAVWGQTTDRADMAPSLVASRRAAGGEVGAPVAVYVDLVPGAPPGDAFARHLQSQPTQFSDVLRLTPQPAGPVPPAAGGALATEIAAQIRSCAANAGTHRVHLFLRVPFAMAILLGRCLNTLETTLYEWDDTTDPPSYSKVVTTASGRGGGPVVRGPA